MNCITWLDSMSRRRWWELGSICRFIYLFQALELATSLISVNTMALWWYETVFIWPELNDFWLRKCKPKHTPQPVISDSRMNDYYESVPFCESKIAFTAQVKSILEWMTLISWFFFLKHTAWLMKSDSWANTYEPVLFREAYSIATEVRFSKNDSYEPFLFCQLKAYSMNSEAWFLILAFVFQVSSLFTPRI